MIMTYSQNQEVHAPYHFVPLSQWVYMPDWAHLVSHDHPFEDGYSGVIDYTLINATPLCVGGEQTRTEGKPALVKWARDPQGNPVIPGSSIKGMLRSVLEIVSFAKLSAVDDSQYSYREVFGGSDYLTFITKHKVQSGWIKFNEVQKRWEFSSCQWAKIKHSEINESFGTSIKNEDSAKDKYKKLPLNKEISTEISEPKGKQQNRWAEKLSNSDGSEKGHIVFTNKRIIGQGNAQDYEFSYFFYNIQDKPKFINIDKKVQNLFNNHLEEQINYLKDHPHTSKGIPVFALLSKTGNLHSFGLAKMPRVSYKNSIGDLVKGQNKANLADSYFDLAELIFGTLRDNGLGLKSRVAFTDATSSEVTANNLYESNALILNAPKPTFYPAYLEQNPKLSAQKKFNDYDDNTAPAGRKRYISIEPEFDQLTRSNITDKDNVASKMELAKVDSKFSGKIIFHNLKAEELGALIWVLELGENIDSYHSLGHGKPYGAGAVKITPEITLMNCNNDASDVNANKKVLMQKFIDQMEKSYPFDNQWIDSPQLKYFHALANMQGNYDINTRYMSIDNKDYQKAKNSGAILEPFNNIERHDTTYEKYCVSASFGKGRLSSLLDQDSSWDNEQIDLQAKSILKAEEKLKEKEDKEQKAELKAQIQNEKEKLRSSDDLSPFEKNKSLLLLIIRNQDALTKTDQKNKTKELRAILKDLKALHLTHQEADSLVEIYTQISISKKDTDKAIKYLKTIA